MIGRRAARVLRERLLGQSSRKRLVNSGALIALVGGDGAGKTTSVNQLHGWLSKKFVVRRFHLGKPPRSPLTLCVLVALRVRRFIKREPSRGPRAHSRNVYESRNFPGYLQMFRWVLAARDRQRVYVKARRFATNGGIAICDRYVVPELLLMDGPNIARSVALKRSNPLIRFLLNAEMKYYRHILPPDLLIVLRVDPDIAVQRKTSEHESHVRTRSQELWEVDWRETRAHVVDAGQPVEDITAQVRSLVWASI
jgi:thymidylate kinase